MSARLSDGALRARHRAAQARLDARRRRQRAAERLARSPRPCGGRSRPSARARAASASPPPRSSRGGARPATTAARRCGRASTSTSSSQYGRPLMSTATDASASSSGTSASAMRTMPRAVAERLVDRLPERDADVLDRVVLVDVQVAGRRARRGRRGRACRSARPGGRACRCPSSPTSAPLPSRSSVTSTCVSFVSRTTCAVAGSARQVRLRSLAAPSPRRRVVLLQPDADAQVVAQHRRVEVSDEDAPLRQPLLHFDRIDAVEPAEDEVRVRRVRRASTAIAASASSSCSRVPVIAHARSSSSARSSIAATIGDAGGDVEVVRLLDRHQHATPAPAP